MSGPLIDVQTVGYREAEGRFAALVDGGLSRSVSESMEAVGIQLRALYHDQASEAFKNGTGKFAESFSHTIVSERTKFLMQLKTSKPDLRRWIRFGTGIHAEEDDEGHRAVGRGEGGRIVPTTASALHWSNGGGDYFARSVAGMKPNKWEDRAREAADALVATEVPKIVGRVVSVSLGGK